MSHKRQFQGISNITDSARKQKIIEKVLSRAFSCLNILREYRELVTCNCQTGARRSRKQFPSRERCDGHFPNRLSQEHVFFFFFFTVCAHQTRIVSLLLHCLRAISEKLSLNFTAMELLPDVLSPFLV